MFLSPTAKEKKHILYVYQAFRCSFFKIKSLFKSFWPNFPLLGCPLFTELLFFRTYSGYLVLYQFYMVKTSIPLLQLVVLLNHVLWLKEYFNLVKSINIFLYSQWILYLKRNPMEMAQKELPKVDHSKKEVTKLAKMVRVNLTRNL